MYWRPHCEAIQVPPTVPCVPRRRRGGGVRRSALPHGSGSGRPAAHRPDTSRRRLSPARRALAAAEMLRVARNIPGDSTPVIVGADDATTWTENGQRIRRRPRPGPDPAGRGASFPPPVRPSPSSTFGAASPTWTSTPRATSRSTTARPCSPAPAPWRRSARAANFGCGPTRTRSASSPSPTTRWCSRGIDRTRRPAPTPPGRAAARGREADGGRRLGPTARLPPPVPAPAASDQEAADQL